MVLKCVFLYEILIELVSQLASGREQSFCFSKVLQHKYSLLDLIL